MPPPTLLLLVCAHPYGTLRGQAGDGGRWPSLSDCCVRCMPSRVNLLLVPCESHLTWARCNRMPIFPSDTDHKQWTVAVVFTDGVSAVISFDVVISEGCMGGINERMLYE